VWGERLAGTSVVVVVVAGIISVMSGLLALVWSPDLPPAPASTCTAEPCFDLDLGNYFPFALLPSVAHVALLGIALLIGGLSLLLSLVAAIRLRRMAVLTVSIIAVVGPIAVLVGGEILPHVLNPCVISDLAVAQPPGFCASTPEGSDVPDNWHALDHAVMGFLPLSLAVAWWWRKQHRSPFPGDDSKRRADARFGSATSSGHYPLGSVVSVVERRCMRAQPAMVRT
jgi:hypothetical protein